MTGETNRADESTINLTNSEIDMVVKELHRKHPELDTRQIETDLTAAFNAVEAERIKASRHHYKASRIAAALGGAASTGLITAAVTSGPAAPLIFGLTGLIVSAYAASKIDGE